ncbi:hypothetical protein [Neisseria sp.]|uniref:hypothetical protein n=1 Tax=Neisseria sp. TaxID=192066 RepID=UPI00359FB0FA
MSEESACASLQAYRNMACNPDLAPVSRTHRLTAFVCDVILLCRQPFFLLATAEAQHWIISGDVVSLSKYLTVPAV